jgi:hypothetical protein
MIAKTVLERLYLQKGQSMQEIATHLKCSLHKVKYWMDKYGIKTRSTSEAIYVWHNPNGDPFKFRLPKTIDEAKLFGMGIGLYWGEGTKANKASVRLGNTDPELLNVFIQFLITFFAVKRSDMRFQLQVFTDINVNEALDFWCKKLHIKKHQFGHPVVTISGSIGTYRKKSQYGVVTVLYHNTKLRDKLMSLLPM